MVASRAARVTLLQHDRLDLSHLLQQTWREHEVRLVNTEPERQNLAEIYLRGRRGNRAFHVAPADRELDQMAVTVVVGTL